MRFITANQGRLEELGLGGLKTQPDRSLATGLEALDGLLPGGALARGAIHEALFAPEHGMPITFALLLARSKIQNPKSQTQSSPIFWLDSQHLLYPPALVAAGIDLDRLYLLHPHKAEDRIWAIAECLRCPGMGAVIADVGRLSLIEARRLQLSAEKGGGIGVLLRPAGSVSSIYAAATRWLVAPSRGDRTVQRWRIQLIHGQGGCVGQGVILEVYREEHHVRAVAPVADRPAAEAETARWRKSA